MPAPNSPNFERAREEQAESGALHPYLSKSRVMGYIKNPRHFYLKYVVGIREPENQAMFRGGRVHKVFEDYYEAVLSDVGRNGVLSHPDDLTRYLPEDTTEWAAWTEPYVVNFVAWERRRLNAAREYVRLTRKSNIKEETALLYAPVAVEDELWDWESFGYPVMGFADVVLWSASVPEVEADEGVTVIDHKTGKSENGFKYGDKPGGVLDELEYYTMLFEGEYEVTATAIYYPKDDALLTATPDEERRAKLVTEINTLCELGDSEEEYPTSPGPLCMYGADPSKRSSYYDLCPDCKWGQQGGPGPSYVDVNLDPV
jgi:CRISPR/Cas system-associated exonuclease Cas4 (RecB family)